MAEHRLMTDAEFAEVEERRDKTFDRIFAVLDTLLQRQGLPPVSSHGAENSSKEICSSSRGAMNSCQETVQQPLHSNYIPPVVESSREIKLRSAELSRQIKQSYTRMINLLQEEIDATESTNDSVPTSAKTLSSMESIDDKSTDESIGLRTSMVRADSESVDNNSLPMLNENFKQHFVSGDDYVGLKMPKSFAHMRLNYSPYGSFSKMIEELNVTKECTMPPPPPKPPNLSCGVMAKPPKPPDTKYGTMVSDLVSECFPQLFDILDVFISVCFPLKLICHPRIGVFCLAPFFKFGEVGTACKVFADMPKVLVGCLNSFFCLSKTTGSLNENKLLSYDAFLPSTVKIPSICQHNIIVIVDNIFNPCLPLITDSRTKGQGKQLVAAVTISHRCLLHVRQNVPTKKPSDWNDSKVAQPPPLPKPPDLCCRGAAAMRFYSSSFYHSFHIDSCVGIQEQFNVYDRQNRVFQLNSIFETLTLKQYGPCCFESHKLKSVFLVTEIYHRHVTFHAFGHQGITVMIIENSVGNTSNMTPSILVFMAWYKVFGELFVKGNYCPVVGKVCWNLDNKLIVYCEICRSSNVTTHNMLTFTKWVSPFISFGTEYDLYYEDLPLLAIIGNVYVAFLTFRSKHESACVSVSSETNIKLDNVLIFSIWQWNPLSDLFSFLYTCALFVDHYHSVNCQQDLNGEKKSTIEVYVFTRSFISIATHVECFFMRTELFQWKLVGIRLHSMFVAPIYAKVLTFSSHSEVFQSLVDAYTHALLELLEEFAMVPYFDQLDIEWLFRVNDIVGAVLQKFYIIFCDGKQLNIFLEVYAATMLYSYLDFWYVEVFMPSVLASPPYWFYVWCGLVDMGYKFVTMLRECEVVIWRIVLLECNSVKQLEESIAKKFVELEQTGLSTKLATLLLAILNTCTWDPGGNGYFFYNEWSLQFHQWDPGGCSLVHEKVHLTWKQRNDITITQQSLSQP